MALTRMALKWNGWQDQAKRLALTHTTVGIAAVAVAEQARRPQLSKRETSYIRTVSTEFQARLESGEIELAYAIEPIRAMLAELEQELARKNAALRFMHEHIKTLTVKVAAADKRIPKLESELRSADEKLVYQENENRSLQTSLDLTVSENQQLSLCLTETNATVDKAYAQLERGSMTLAAVVGERNKLAIAVDEANLKSRTEINALNTRLEAMESRAVAAENLLVEARQNLLERFEENSAANRELADAVVARHAVDEKLGLLHNSLQIKEREVGVLEQSRSKLMAGASILLETLKARATALACAEERIKLLSGRLADADANFVKSQETVEKLTLQLQGDRTEHAIVEAALKKLLTAFAKGAMQVGRSH